MRFGRCMGVVSVITGWGVSVARLAMTDDGNKLNILMNVRAVLMH